MNGIEVGERVSQWAATDVRIVRGQNRGNYGVGGGLIKERVLVTGMGVGSTWYLWEGGRSSWGDGETR